jgi:AcrR family transcriptional regulator
MARPNKRETKAGGPPVALSRDTILETALRLVDEHGVNAVSMRAVAADLGVTPMALYFHVANKAELLDAVIHRVVAMIELPEHPDATWEELMLAFARSGRRVMLAHPGVAAAIIAESPSGVGEPGLLLGERIYAAMTRAGFADVDMVTGFYTVMVFTLGFVAMETPRHPTPLAAGERDAVVERMESFFASLPTTAFPHTVRLASDLARITTEEQFDGGVGAIVAGLRSRLPVPPDGRAPAHTD